LSMITPEQVVSEALTILQKHPLNLVKQ